MASYCSVAGCSCCAGVGGVARVRDGRRRGFFSFDAASWSNMPVPVTARLCASEGKSSAPFRVPPGVFFSLTILPPAATSRQERSGASPLILDTWRKIDGLSSQSACPSLELFVMKGCEIEPVLPPQS